MHQSRKKRISWFIQDESEDEKDSNQNTHMSTEKEQQETIPQPQQIIKQSPNRNIRKISLFLQQRQPSSSPDQKLSVIKEETPSNKKSYLRIKNIIQNSAYQTPKSIVPEFRSQIKNSIQVQSTTKLDFMKELNYIQNSLENQQTQLKKITQREQQEIQQIRDMLQQKNDRMRERLRIMNQEYEKITNNKVNDKQIVQEQQIIIEQPKITIGSSVYIRQQVVKLLGFRVEDIQYKSNQFYLTLDYFDQQCKLSMQLQSQKSNHKQLNIDEITKEFRKQMHDNGLILQNLDIQAFTNKIKWNKGEIIKNSLKSKYVNTSLQPGQLIERIIHYMPNLLEEINNLEDDLYEIERVWGCWWKVDLESNAIQVLMGYRFRISQETLSPDKMMFRFIVSLKNFKIELFDSSIYNEIIQPWGGMNEVTFGENVEIQSHYKSVLQSLLGLRLRELIEQIYIKFI